MLWRAWLLSPEGRALRVEALRVKAANLSTAPHRTFIFFRGRLVPSVLRTHGCSIALHINFLVARLFTTESARGSSQGAACGDPKPCCRPACSCLPLPTHRSHTYTTLSPRILQIGLVFFLGLAGHSPQAPSNEPVAQTSRNAAGGDADVPQLVACSGCRVHAHAFLCRVRRSGRDRELLGI